MKRRRNALICLLTVCLMATTAQTDVLAQEAGTESNSQTAQEIGRAHV